MKIKGDKVNGPSVEGYEKLRATYVKFLRDTGAEYFGPPLDHGDQLGSVGDVEADPDALQGQDAATRCSVPARPGRWAPVSTRYPNGRQWHCPSCAEVFPEDTPTVRCCSVPLVRTIYDAAFLDGETENSTLAKTTGRSGSQAVSRATIQYLERELEQAAEAAADHIKRDRDHLWRRATWRRRCATSQRTPTAPRPPPARCSSVTGASESGRAQRSFRCSSARPRSRRRPRSCSGSAPRRASTSSCWRGAMPGPGRSSTSCAWPTATSRTEPGPRRRSGVMPQKGERMSEDVAKREHDLLPIWMPDGTVALPITREVMGPTRAFPSTPGPSARST